MPELESDIIVIGGGMAGSAVAAHLSQHAKVQLLEMETQPGYHSTGRSAALFSESYGNEIIRALTRASRGFFFSPPEGFCETALVKPRSVLIIAQEHQRAMLAHFKAGAETSGPIDEISADQAVALCPILRRERVASALISRSPADIEVHELQQGYLRLLKARGGRITTDAEVTGLARTSQGWEVETRSAVYRAPRVVNAAGAWAGQIGALAGAQEIGITPCRRTAMLIDAPAGYQTHDWPMLLDVEEQFYLKPDAGLLLLSPADETPVEPSDVQPEELDIAIAVDRLETATTLQVRHVRRKWAGLRSFAPDRSPVVGYDTLQPGFFWLAALGGYGIQTAPALSALAARLVLDLGPGEVPAQFGIETSALDPTRLSPGVLRAAAAARGELGG
ncbi:MAG: NAD(P)/FAD-dependent oxidoreductase [Phenylobacterium sp.]